MNIVIADDIFVWNELKHDKPFKKSEFKVKQNTNVRTNCGLKKNCNFIQTKNIEIFDCTEKEEKNMKTKHNKEIKK